MATPAAGHFMRLWQTAATGHNLFLLRQATLRCRAVTAANINAAALFMLAASA